MTDVALLGRPGLVEGDGQRPLDHVVAGPRPGFGHVEEALPDESKRASDQVL